MEMEEDNYGLHFGAFYQDDLVGVISLFQQGTDYQFRKFAVSPSMQNQGVGTAILQHISDFAKSQGGTRLWCNARSTATNFYYKHGFQENGETFTRKGINYLILEKDL
ncbi:GNAT family N-acetyltransferase [Mucilaginibacter robiniae]|uniref:GNAT family N-acetyltransferase n=2 Tax=Mucilaginibacter robiniae TaxID=2728022 RepID=A0A7L5E5V3_9SPHI|nr:GNAT family N-acetyltransferase [Mucilaginibacter robiniae]